MPKLTNIWPSLNFFSPLHSPYIIPPPYLPPVPSQPVAKLLTAGSAYNLAEYGTGKSRNLQDTKVLTKFFFCKEIAHADTAMYTVYRIYLLYIAKASRSIQHF